MKPYARVLLLAVACLFLMAPRWATDKPGAGRARITIYKVAAGRQVDFLKWMAVQPGVRLIPVANLKSLSTRDREAALRFGGEENHAFAIEGS